MRVAALSCQDHGGLHPRNTGDKMREWPPSETPVNHSLNETKNLRCFKCESTNPRALKTSWAHIRPAWPVDTISQSKSKMALKGTLACFLCFREKYSQYLSARVLDSQGRTLKDAKSSFYYHLTQMAWVPAYKPTQDGKNSVEYLIPNRVYLFSDKVHSLLGSHVCYVDLNPSQFSSAVGKQISTDPSASWMRSQSTWDYLFVFNLAE